MEQLGYGLHTMSRQSNGTTQPHQHQTTQKY